MTKGIIWLQYMKFRSPLNEMGISYKDKVYSKKFKKKIILSLGPTICSTTNNKKFKKKFM
jgi:hypothetical protein